jgi:hypothetical protein
MRAVNNLTCRPPPAREQDDAAAAVVHGLVPLRRAAGAPCFSQAAVPHLLLSLGSPHAADVLLNLYRRPQGYNPYDAYGQQPAATTQQPPAQVCPAALAERRKGAQSLEESRTSD